MTRLVAPPDRALRAMPQTLDLFAPPPSVSLAPTSLRAGFDTGLTPSAPTDAQRDGGVFPTPMWVAQALVEQFFPELDASHCVLEPTCGSGRFLRAIPGHVPAIGVERDPRLAAEAAELSRRRVLVGDIRSVSLDVRPTRVIGNPPFNFQLFSALLDRCHEWLPADGRAGFLLPCYFLQTAHTVRALNQKWGIEQHLVPRNVFPGLSKPLAFVLFSRSRARTMVGFALYHEVAEVREMPDRYRSILTDGKTSSVWAQLVDAALAALGGEASTRAIVEEATARREPELAARNHFPAQKIRQTLQRYFHPTAPGRWSRLPAEQVA